MPRAPRGRVVPIKTPKKKAVNYERLEREQEPGHTLYMLMDEVVAVHRNDLADCRIAIAWARHWKPDVDGRMRIGQMKKASDLEKEFAAFDFVMMLNPLFFKDARVTELQRKAGIHHQLMHAAPLLDEKGAQKLDDRNRLCWRTRKHEIEEFVCIPALYGSYCHELEELAKVIAKDVASGFTPCEQNGCQNGWRWVLEESIVDHTKVPRLARCECFTRYQEARADVAAAM